MPNVKSAKKRMKTSLRDNLRNKHYKTMVKTEIKKAVAAIEAGEKENAEKFIKSAIKTINKVSAKGIIHKNTAARRESNLTRKFNAMAK